MRLLTGIVAFAILTSFAPAFAGDVSADRNWAQQEKERRNRAASVQADKQQPVDEKMAASLPRTCDCMARNDHAAR